MTRKGGPHKAQLELLEMSLKAKKVDFSKVLAMIDGMVPARDSGTLSITISHRFMFRKCGFFQMENAKF